MQCARCRETEVDDHASGRWCGTCERDYDSWSRQHASDIVWSALGGMVVVLTAGMLVPALGVSWLFALSGVFAGFGTILGIHRFNRNRRRRQFLAGAAMPRAYLPESTGR
jgi:hypothetical protein